MLKLGYAATAQDLSSHMARGVRIDKITGMPPNAYKQAMALRSPDHVTRPSWITLRPGLSSPMKFYGVIHGGAGILVCMSDRHQSRYYWLSEGKRETVLIDSPSHDITQAIDTLFRGLLVDDSNPFRVFYRSVVHLILTHFVGLRVPQFFTVEGLFKRIGPSFIAQIEWRPEDPTELCISSTMDRKLLRKVSLLSHPIAEVHKQCHR
jgi:hypothetical protein